MVQQQMQAGLDNSQAMPPGSLQRMTEPDIINMSMIFLPHSHLHRQNLHKLLIGHKMGF